MQSAEKPDGTFLVRESVDYADTLMLCVVHNEVVEELPIDHIPLPVDESVYAYGNLLLDAAVDLKLKFRYELRGDPSKYDSLDQLVSTYAFNKAPLTYVGTSSTRVSVRLRVVCLHVYYTTAQSNFKRVGSRIEWSSTRKSNFSRFVI